MAIHNSLHHIVNQSNTDITLGQGRSLPSDRVSVDIWFHASFAAYTDRKSVTLATCGVGFYVSNHMTKMIF